VLGDSLSGLPFGDTVFAGEGDRVEVPSNFGFLSCLRRVNNLRNVLFRFGSGLVMLMMCIGGIELINSAFSSGVITRVVLSMSTFNVPSAENLFAS
jgi:hypothetical protein